MLNWIISSSLLILVVWGLGTLFKNGLSARFRYALWAVVLVRLLIPGTIGESSFSVEDRLQAIPGVQAAETLRGVDNIEYVHRSGSVVTHGGLMDDDYKTVAENVTETEFHRMERVLTVREVLMPLWCLGMAVMAAVFLAANRRFARRLRESREPLETDCGVPVYVTAEVETPCLFGLFPPAIYVTSEAAADENRLRHCLAHEETHRRHGDHIWAALRCLCLVVHWYNPLVWWAARLSRRDSELACDEGALLRLGEEERFGYGRTLIAVTCEGRGGLLTAAITMADGKKSLTQRVQRIAKRPKAAAYALALAALGMLAATVCAFVGAKEEAAGALAGTPVFRQDAEITAITLHSLMGEDPPVGEEYLETMVQWARSFSYEVVQEETTLEPDVFSLTVTYSDGTSKTCSLDQDQVEGVTYKVARDPVPAEAWRAVWQSARMADDVAVEVWSGGEMAEAWLYQRRQGEKLALEEEPDMPRVHWDQDFALRTRDCSLSTDLTVYTVSGALVEKEVPSLPDGEYICVLGIYGDNGGYYQAQFGLTVEKASPS